MDLKDKLLILTKEILKHKDNINNEETTKNVFILPFFELLGYDIRNPSEFIAEFVADIGGAKGEKVDYAIFINEVPLILIEAKDCNDTLKKADKQLMRYFGTSEAKIGILTNGIIYKFYTDLDETNKMDKLPFLEINLLNVTDSQINELKTFEKNTFKVVDIADNAEKLKYSGLTKILLKKEFGDPSEKFINYIFSEIFDGSIKKTPKIKNKYFPVIKKSILEFINEHVKSKLEDAITNQNTVIEKQNELIEEQSDNSRIVITEEELEGLRIVKSLLDSIVDVSRICYKKSSHYFGIFLDKPGSKTIIRLIFNSKTKRVEILLPDGNKKKEKKIELHNGLSDLNGLKSDLIESINDYEKNGK